MAKRSVVIKSVGTPKFTKGEKVTCTDYNELPESIVRWLKSKPAHTIKHVYAPCTEPVLILEPIDGLESPKMDSNLYPFLSDRFIKV